jgi:hypothetical protein
MSTEQFSINQSEGFIRLLSKEQEEKVRNEIISTFELNYLQYYFPFEQPEFDGPGSNLLVSLDYLGKDKGSFSFVHKKADLKLVVPYLDLDERFYKVFDRDIDFGQPKPLRREGRITLPQIKGLSDRLDWHRGKEVFFYSSFYALLPYNNGLQKGIENLQIAQDAGQNPIGELYIGHKWQSENTIAPTALNTTIATLKK